MAIAQWGSYLQWSLSYLIIGSGNGLSPVRCHAIAWTNTDLLSIGPSGTNFSDIWILTIMVFTEKMHLKMSSVIWQPFYSWLIVLTLNVRGPSYLGLTRSISWLLMPWLLTSPGHQQPWYWLCRIGRFLSYLRKDFNYLCRINLEKWHKM